MYADLTSNPITHRDRLVTTVSFAVLLHAMIILGVTFTADRGKDSQGSPTLEIVLVNAPTDDPPDEADYLADASQRGAGNTDERVRPRSPDASRGDPDSRSTATRGDSPLTGQFNEDRADDSRTRAASVPDPVIASTRGHLSFALTVRTGGGSATPSAYGTNLNLPSISADTDAHTPLAFSENQRERWVDVNTREALFAAYLDSWRERVERVGNLNYPDEARRQGLRGALTLEVALGPSGNVRELRVRSGSGHRILDDAALRIVYMAAPFPAFPEDLAREVDLLRFAFVWDFGDDATSSVRAGARGR